MKAITIESFSIIGISTRTTNEKMQSATDIRRLWDKFLSEKIIDQIPGKIDDTVYCIYTDYEKDETKPYTTIFGCKVKNLDFVPEGFTAKTIETGNYKLFTIKGKLTDNIIFQKWKEIWNADIKRKYTADYEVYGEKARNPDNAEVDIFVAIE